MVPLKLDLCDDRPETLCARPQLVLTDWSAEKPTARQPRCSAFARWENAFLATAASAAIGYFLLSAAASLGHSIQRSYSSPALPQTIVIAKTVARGDTLSGLALRYGDPSTYILEREDQIARANHLTGTRPLLPGQHLRIPVSNPTVIAQILRFAHRPLVASR